MEASRAFELYKEKSNEQISWLNLHQKTSQQYFALVSAVLAAALVVFINNLGHIGSDISLFGFILNLFLCYAGKSTCRRYYHRFLETVSTMAKIEPLIGITAKRKSKRGSYNSLPFPYDFSYLPVRWENSRRKYKTSIEFIKNELKGGANKYIRMSFNYLFMTNAFFSLIIIIRFIIGHRWHLLLKI